MVVDGIMYTVSGAAAVKAGLNYNTAIPHDHGWVSWISGACMVIDTMTRKQWDFNATSVDIKSVLQDTASDFVAMKAVNFDMSVYTTRGEAESMINVLRDGFLRNVQILRDVKAQTFVDGV